VTQRRRRKTGSDGFARYSRARRTTSMHASGSTSDGSTRLEPAVHPQLRHPPQSVPMARKDLQQSRLVTALDAPLELDQVARFTRDHSAQLAKLTKFRHTLRDSTIRTSPPALAGHSAFRQRRNIFCSVRLLLFRRRQREPRRRSARFRSHLGGPESGAPARSLKVRCPGHARRCLRHESRLFKGPRRP
jgi:hypothetical protein